MTFIQAFPLPSDPIYHCTLFCILCFQQINKYCLNQKVVQCVEGKSESKKKYTVPNICQNRRPYRTQTLISILGIPITFSQHNGKCNICEFHEEIHAFEAWMQVLDASVRLSSLVLASEWTTNRKKVCSLIDRYMTSELILPFTSKMFVCLC